MEFSPKFGYQVKDVIIDGVSIGKVKSYTFVSMDANHTVAVEYEYNGALIAIIVICGSLFIAIIVVIILAILEIRKNGNLARWVRKLHKSSAQNEQ